MIAVRKERLRRLIELSGKSPTRWAADVGISVPTLYRMLRGAPVSQQTIAKVLAALPQYAFDDLFYIEDREAVTS